ncbi:alpha/beta hydrolase family protein [Shewanella intestini]|uniref:S9 family peptidase n=1 Tax=Shewanella intestini TaxID=2017544 RepID=A0ABS5I719_9GAMM|nr:MULTISPECIES: S9 family peptidase [Shewanella]MBR9729524.1 S9 family peptidase [Shewanella intestini]MRG37535.1 prolyl oligopeptidase family serine peptidase [Shewanella sp. XMDDZSB0408]
MKFLLLLLSCLLACLHTANASSLTNAQQFSRGAEYSNVKISPNGDYLSALTSHEGRKTLVILNADTKKLLHAVRFTNNAEVGEYAWVNEERIVLQKMYKKGWSEEPLYYGELFAVNADGSRSTNLFGFKSGEQQTGSNLKKNTPIKASAFILDPLPDNDRYMLVNAIPWSGGTSLDYSRPQHVYRVDIYKGIRKKVTTAPIGYAQFLTDNEGKVKFISGTSKDNEQKLFYRQNKKWVNTDELNLGLDNFYPISFTDKPNTIFAAGRIAGETLGVYKIDLTAGTKQKIIQDEQVDPNHFWVNNQTKKLYAVEYQNGYPTYAFVDKEDTHSKLLKQLLASLPGKQVHIVSETTASDKFIIKAFNDRNPGDYYLFDSNKMKLEYLASQKSWLDPELMAEMKPISFTSRDGKTIHGYLTLPNGKDAKQLPLIVNPHGGPHGVRDWWGFNPQNQLLAQQGFAVLQVNFRGSAGYGKDFLEAGKQKWGSDIQFDIIDATKHVIAQENVDANKVCIVGGSFGGYSALQSAILEPDLFKCAIGFAGIYDLEMMFEEGDIAERRAGMKYLQEVLGEDKATLHAMSPTKHVSKLKAKLMLVHGEDDARAPIEQLEALEEALDKIDYPYQKLVMNNEGHGFYNDTHRAKYYQQMIQFINQSLSM